VAARPRAPRPPPHGREASCATVRTTIAEGDGRALRAGPIRAHLRTCAECRAVTTPGRVRSRVAALVPTIPAVLRALLAGPADPVAAPAKALAVAAVLTVGTGGVASDVRHAPPKAAATTATAPKKTAKSRHAVHKRAVVVQRASVVTPQPRVVGVAVVRRPPKPRVVERPAAEPPKPKPQDAPRHGQSPESRPDAQPPPEQAHMARTPCPEPTQTSQPAPTPS
jgi:hypothetical protein